MSPAARQLHLALDKVLGPSRIVHDMPPGPQRAAVEQQLLDDRVKAIHSIMPWAQASSNVTALAIVWILWPRLPHLSLLIWLGTRLVLSVARWAYAVRCQASPERHNDRLFVMGAFLDGVAWGALGWGLTPLHNLEVAVVTVAMGVAISAMGATMLHVHTRANLAFLLPITVPNAIYALFRGDDLGVFCCVGYLGMAALLAIESLRLQRRSHDNIRLRLESELARQAEVQARQEAQQLADMRTRFVATISHEMRTPLHGMLGLMRMIEAQAHQPPNAEHLDLMRRSGEHLASIINDVLDYARIETAELATSSAPLCLDRTLHDVIAMTRVHAQGKGLSLTLHSNLSPNTWVTGDEMRIRQVLINLIGNAIKFTDAGGVKLIAQRDAVSGHTQLSVVDTGIGISQADQRTIFAPFTQAETQASRRLGGTGLGLTISRSLCQAMGGDLRCDSQLGTGTTFTCELPLPLATQPRTAHTEPPPLETLTHAKPADGEPEKARKPLVLLVDDNPVNTLVAEAELQSLGVTVHAVDGGQAAVTWFKANHPDLVLMDCEMPGMDGVAATRLMRETERQQGRPQVSIVALTANGREAYEERCVAAGMSDYLCKPFDQADLVSLLKRHLPRQPQPELPELVD